MSLLLMRQGAGTLPKAITLAADDATVSVTQGSTVTINLTLTRSNCTDPVALAVAGLPTGVTGSFSDSTLTGAETSSVLTLTATGGASTVTDDAFTITADAGNGVTSTVNGTCTVVSALSGIIAGDDWTGYANDAAFIAAVDATTKYQSDSINTGTTDPLQLAHLDTTVLYNGHPTCRYDFPELSSEVPQLVGNMPGDYTDVWLNTCLKFSPGFTITGSPQVGAFSYKMMGFGLRTTGVTSRTIFISTNGQGSVGGAANDGDIQVEQGRGTSGLDLAFLSPTVRRFVPILNDDKWYRFVMHYKVLGNRTVIRTWIYEDGTTPANYGLNDLMQHRVAPLTAYSVLLNRNFNNPRPAGGAQDLWWGEWFVIDGSVNPDPFGFGLAENITRLFTVSASVSSLSIARGASGSVVLTRNATGDWNTPKFNLDGPDPTNSGAVLSGTGVTISRGANNSTNTTETVTFNVAAGATPGTYLVPIYTDCYESGFNGRVNYYNEITLTVT